MSLYATEHQQCDSMNGNVGRSTMSHEFSTNTTELCYMVSINDKAMISIETRLLVRVEIGA